MVSREFLDVVGRIYDGVFDRSRRPEAIGAAVQMVGGTAGTLLSHALPSQEPERATEFGNDPAFSLSYATTYARINPLFAMSVLEMGEGDVRTLHRDVDLDAFRRTRFSREWFEPQTWGDWACVMISRSQSRLSQLVVARSASAPSYSDEQVVLLEGLAGHFRRAAEIGRIIGRYERRDAGLSALLDQLHTAALLVDDRGRVEFANARAEAVCAAGEVLSVDAERRLRVRDRGAARIVREAAEGAARTPDSVVVESAGGKMTLSTLPPSAATGEFAAVLLNAHEPIGPPPAPVLNQLYGVTQAEIRVLQLLVAGQTVHEIADVLDVTARTVRAHIQSLFEKVGVSRQVDLVRCALGASPRLVARP